MCLTNIDVTGRSTEKGKAARHLKPFKEGLLGNSNIAIEDIEQDLVQEGFEMAQNRVQNPDDLAVLRRWMYSYGSAYLLVLGMSLHGGDFEAGEVVLNNIRMNFLLYGFETLLYIDGSSIGTEFTMPNIERALTTDGGHIKGWPRQCSA